MKLSAAELPNAKNAATRKSEELKYMRTAASTHYSTFISHKPNQERSRSESSVDISVKNVCVYKAGTNMRREALAEIRHHHLTCKSQMQRRKRAEHKP